MAGRKAVEPNLADSLKTRNHLLDDMFSAKTIIMKEKKKKPKATDDDDDISDEEEAVDSDGYHIVEKVGVSHFYSILLGDSLLYVAISSLAPACFW